MFHGTYEQSQLLYTCTIYPRIQPGGNWYTKTHQMMTVHWWYTGIFIYLWYDVETGSTVLTF